MSSVNHVQVEKIEEGQRVASICNACRYCEGFCAVFPALERRLSFSESDLIYLANLCHNCGSCYHACQYTPPHEYALNLPKALAEIRAQTYKKYAWPELLASLFDRNGIVTSLVTAASLAVFILASFFFVDPSALFSANAVDSGSFYALIPHKVMVLAFGVVGIFVLIAFAAEFVRFWRDTGERASDFVRVGTITQATSDALTLKYLGGGGDGCTYPDDRPSMTRKWFHHLTFYGFMLCFAATAVATIYHYGFGWRAPYSLLSLPVVLGTVGGLGLLVGPLGLLWLRTKRNPELSDQKQTGMDVGFLVLLFVTSLTGLLLLFLRETSAMGTLLAVHLGVVMALFLTMPYGKFVHAIYRLAALARFSIERRRPAPKFSSE